MTRHFATLVLAASIGLVPACNPDPYPGEQGTVLHVALSTLPKSMDPPYIEDAPSGMIAAQVYDGLLQYHPYARPFKLIPSIAAAMPEVSEDRLTYTFTLRDDIRFTDDECFEDGKGRQVTAEDFLFIFKRFAHPRTGAKGWWLFDGRILGLDDWRAGLQRDGEIRRLVHTLSDRFDGTATIADVANYLGTDPSSTTSMLDYAAAQGAPYWADGALVTLAGEGETTTIALTETGTRFVTEELADGWQTDKLWQIERPIIGTRTVPVAPEPSPSEDDEDPSEDDEESQEEAPQEASTDEATSGASERDEAATDDATAEPDEAPPATETIEVAGLEVIDSRTFRIQLSEPYPQFLWTLAMTYTSVYPREAIEHYGDEYRTNPVGTGPFRMAEYNPVYRATLTKNESFREERVPDPANNPAERWEGWEDDVAAGYIARPGEQLPLIDGMEIRFILEDQPRWLYFKAGYIDYLVPPKDNIAEAIPGGKLSDEMKERGVVLEPEAELGTVYTTLNTADPVLSNADLRRAMALAIDHKWVVENLYSNQAVIAKSLIPPGVAGYNPDVHPHHSDDGTAQLDAAKAMLAKAGYPDGIDPKTGKQLEITFEAAGASLTSRQFTERFVDDMKRIGIKVRPNVNTFPKMIEKLRGSNYQAAGLAWGFDYPDAQNILQLLYGPNKSPGPNAANFQNAEYDALYEQASTLPDGPERTALYEQMAAIVGQEVPWITRAHRIRQMLKQPWLQGYKYTSNTYQYWRFAGIDKELRDKELTAWNQPVWWPVALIVGLILLAIIGTVATRRPRA